MLFVLNIYQILSCCISMAMFIRSLLAVPKQTMNLELYPGAIVLLLLPLFIIYSNIQLLFNKEKKKKYFDINKWFNFVQLFQLSFFGYTFYLIIGLDLTPSIFYSDNIKFVFQSFFFTLRLNLSYHPSDSSINAGINLIPLLSLIILDKAFREKYSKI